MSCCTWLTITIPLLRVKKLNWVHLEDLFFIIHIQQLDTCSIKVKCVLKLNAWLVFIQRFSHTTINF